MTRFQFPQPSLYIFASDIGWALGHCTPSRAFLTRPRSSAQLTPMYSCEKDHTAAARAAFNNTSYQPCAAPRSLHLAAHKPGQQQVVLPAAAALQPRRAKSKKHGAPRPSSSSSSRRSSTTVVATDVNNFRAMVQELTGFPPAAIFRPLPRRVHAASPLVVGSGAGHGGSEAINNSTAAAAGGSPDAPAALPVMAHPPQCAPLGVFDGLSDLGSPEFDSWGDLSMEQALVGSSLSS